MLVLLALSLFVASALLLPSRSEDEQSGLQVYFEQDGRYALLFLSAYLFLGLVVNVSFFKSSPIALWGVLDVIMIALPLCAFAAKSRRHYASIALIYIPITAFDLVVSLAG